MNLTNIGWCSHSWNPITGCNGNCPYCYARVIARRFCTNEWGHDWGSGMLPCDGDCRDCSWMDGLEFTDQKIRIAPPGAVFPFGFYPTFYPDRIDEPMKAKKHRDIFVCSMADLFGWWVPLDYIIRILDACSAAPQHTFLFLTKNPVKYRELLNLDILPVSTRFWYGVTVTNQNDAENESLPFRGEFASFWSMEPLHGPVDFRRVHPSHWPRRVIVGAETGNHKNKIIPQREWVIQILTFCDEARIPVFLKDNLLKLYPDLPVRTINHFW